MDTSSLFSKTISLRQPVGISDAEFAQFRDFIYEKSGIFVEEKRKYLLEHRFSKRLNELNLKSFSEYLQLLKFDARRTEEMKVLYELITTNETSLFRDTKQLDSFKNVVLAEVLAAQRKAGKFELNIWSAGCSSGEEPYTLSIMLHEALGPELSRWRVTITANDLSPAMIAKAKAGVYTDYAFKTTPAEIKTRYFKPAAGGLQVDPKVQKLVNFQLINLNDPLAVKRVPKSQIVFCRNVIIYFDDAMKKRVAQAFYDNLLPNGYLILGHSESLHKITTTFRPKFISGAMAYQRV